ncbi:hypothetical protein MMC21_001367 [Puttea exsequens]|nr:hypothetical protein [Puttea exsequens]
MSEARVQTPAKRQREDEDMPLSSKRILLQVPRQPEQQLLSSNDYDKGQAKDSAGALGLLAQTNAEAWELQQAINNDRNDSAAANKPRKAAADAAKAAAAAESKEIKQEKEARQQQQPVEQAKHGRRNAGKGAAWLVAENKRQRMVSTIARAENHQAQLLTTPRSRRTEAPQTPPSNIPVISCSATSQSQTLSTPLGNWTERLQHRNPETTQASNGTPTTKDDLQAMVRAHEAAEAKAMKQHQAALAAHQARQIQEVEMHLKQKRDDAQKKR